MMVYRAVALTIALASHLSFAAFDRLNARGNLFSLLNESPEVSIEVPFADNMSVGPTLHYSHLTRNAGQTGLTRLALGVQAQVFVTGSRSENGVVIMPLWRIAQSHVVGRDGGSDSVAEATIS